MLSTYIGTIIYMTFKYINIYVRKMLKFLSSIIVLIYKAIKWALTPLFFLLAYIYKFFGLVKIVRFFANIGERLYIAFFEKAVVYLSKGSYWFRLIFKGGAYVPKAIRKNRLKAKKKARYEIWLYTKAIASNVDVVSWVISR